MKIPRKLKKKLKAIILRTIDPKWKSKELCIKNYETNSHFERMRLRFGNKCVTSWTLGYNSL